MQEDTQALDGGAACASNAVPAPGQWVREWPAKMSRAAPWCFEKESDCRPPALAWRPESAWPSCCRVAARPRVALFSTGDELAMPWRRAARGHAAGRHLQQQPLFLNALLRRLGCVVTDLGIVPDRPRRHACTRCARPRAARPDPDQRRRVGGRGRPHQARRREQLGTLDLWQIAMKPGKPFAYGRLRREPTRGRAGALHRPARQPGVELRHLPAAGAAVPAAAAGRRRCCYANDSCPRRFHAGQGR
jgi:molybdopterin molybdotransferase